MTALARANRLYHELQHAEETQRQVLAFDVAAAINTVTNGLVELGAPDWLVRQLHTRASLRLLGALDPARQGASVITTTWLDYAVTDALLSGDATRVAVLARYATEPDTDRGQISA